MEDIIADSEGYDNGRGLSDNVSKKFNSLEDDRVDSGVELSIGYFSAELSNLISEAEDENNEQEQNDAKESKSNLRSHALEKSFQKLHIDNNNRSSLQSPVDLNQCDSGVDEKYFQESIPDPREYSFGKEHWVSPHFSPEQIVEIFKGDEDGDNHLHLSIIHGLPEVTMQVIGLAPRCDWLNQTNNMLQTPLHLAVITRQVAVVQRLMCAGASVDVLDQLGNTPLHNACRLGFEDVVRTLLTPVRYEETYQNKYIIPSQQIPQDLESKNYEGLTCLHLAAIGGHINVMRLLLNSGACVNSAEGKSGRTVLHLAADWGHNEMLKYLLLQRDINIDASTYGGLTPILLAYGRQHIAVVQELHKRGASCETLSLSEDSDGDISDEEMMDDVLLNRAYTGSVERGFQLTNR